MLHPLAALQAFDDRRLLVQPVPGDQLEHRLADDLLGGIAEEALRPFVPAGDDAVEVLADDGVVRRADNGGEKYVRPGLAPGIGDVAGDLGPADDQTLGIPEGGNRHRDIDQAPILSPPLGFRALDANPVTDLVQDFRLLLLPARRDQHQDRAADRLVAAIAEDPLRRLVPARDGPVQVLADNRIVGRVDDSRQERFGKRWIGSWSEISTHGSCNACPCAGFRRAYKAENFPRAGG